MIGEKVISTRAVCLAEVEAMMMELRKNKDQAKELNYEQDLTFTYSKKFASMTAHQAEKAREAFEAIPGVAGDSVLVSKLLDFLPVEAEFIETIAGKNPKLGAEDIQAIIDVSKKYQKE